MYDQLASVYDYFVNWESRLSYELPFLLRTLTALGPTPTAMHVLDAACGTGQHALALAREGYQVTGTDLFPQMIEIARSHAAAASLPANFQTAAFGSISETLQQAGQFDALLCLGNSLPHVHSWAELEQTLTDFSRLLRPGGLLVTQMRNFDQVMAARNRWMEPQSVEEPDHEWLFFRFYDFEADGRIQFNILSMQREKPGPWQIQHTTTQLLPILSTPYLQALHASGFSQVATFGNMHGDSFDPGRSGDLIITAVKDARSD